MLRHVFLRQKKGIGIGVGFNDELHDYETFFIIEYF